MYACILITLVFDRLRLKIKHLNFRLHIIKGIARNIAAQSSQYIHHRHLTRIDKGLGKLESTGSSLDLIATTEWSSAFDRG